MRQERYSNIIGYQFGTIENGNCRIYNGSIKNPENNKMLYEFIYTDSYTGKLTGYIRTDYKTFRNIIDSYAYPKK